MSILLANIDATCASLGTREGSNYAIGDDTIQNLKHLIWILRRDNQDSHEYRRYIGHMKVLQTDLLPMLVATGNNSDLSDILLRLLVNLMSPAMEFFREDLPKDGAGRRIYLDLVEISQAYKETFANYSAVWRNLVERLKKILNIDTGVRSEEQNLVAERIFVLTRYVLQVPTNPQEENRTENDINIHDKVVWALNESGILEIVTYILSSEYESQFQIYALEITQLVFREQKVETLANALVQRSVAEKQADEQALIAARRMEKSKQQIRIPPARHSRFGGTYVYKNLKSVSDRDLICHQPLERVVQKDFNHDKKKTKKNFRLARDDDKFERQSAFCIRIFLREFAIEILTSAFNNFVRQIRWLFDRNREAAGGHQQSYLLWAIRFFLEFNRLNDFKLHLVTEALSTGSIHWICNQIQNNVEMLQTDKKRKIKWNRRLQLAIQAYREILHNLQVMELDKDENTQALLGKLKNNMFYVVEYREIVLQLLLSYNENHFTRVYLRDLIDTTNVYLKMMEKFCQGNILVQTKVKGKTKRKKPVTKPKKQSKEEVLDKLHNEWDARVSSNLSVVLVNDINLPEEEHPPNPLDVTSEKSNDEQRDDCITKITKYLREEDYERAVLLMRAGRACWTESECFGAENIQPEDELMLMKEIYFKDIETGSNDNEGKSFWDELENSDSNNEESVDDEDDDDEEEEEETAYKEVVLNFSDFEKRLLNPKVVRACTWCLQLWEKMNYREIKSAVTLLHRIAVNLNVPVMLMQAQLFRVFQQVFNAPRDNRHEELRRLGIFIVRNFVKIAPTNPKIFAELLFFKSSRDCYEIENGYSVSSYGGHEAKQKAWSEEDEDELRRLFMENQESPANDQDVVDWIVDNLSEKSRTRRGVIKKLKELGLIFKAPTKRSNAAAVNKNLFIQEEDDKLRELYDEHRLEADCFERIMEAFNKKRNKKSVAKRMVQLGLIADESEILPAKKSSRKHREGERRNESSSEDSQSESDDDFVSNRNSISKPLRQSETRKYQMNTREVTSLRIELEESLKEGIEWIIESLNEAADDFEESSDDPDDAIPIVPLSDSHKFSLENQQFLKLLEGINLIAPHGTEIYWKIPANMMPDELRRRSKMLSGEELIENVVNDNQNSSDDESEDENLFLRLRAHRDALVYNQSDHEDDSCLPLKKLNTKLVKELVSSVSLHHGDALKWIVKRLNEKEENVELLLTPLNESHETVPNDVNFQRLLVSISFIKPESVESLWRIPRELTIKDIKERVDLLETEVVEESSDDESQQMIIKRKNKKMKKDEHEGGEINTQALKDRLAELEDSSDDDEVVESVQKNLESSDDDEEVSKVKNSKKRERSNTETPDENEMNATNNQSKRIRRIADSSDDE